MILSSLTTINKLQFQVFSNHTFVNFLLFHTNKYMLQNKTKKLCKSIVTYLTILNYTLFYSMLQIFLSYGKNRQLKRIFIFVPTCQTFSKQIHVTLAWHYNLWVFILSTVKIKLYSDKFNKGTSYLVRSTSSIFNELINLQFD